MLASRRSTSVPFRLGLIFDEDRARRQIVISRDEHLSGCQRRQGGAGYLVRPAGRSLVPDGMTASSG